MPSDRLAGWLATLGITIMAGMLRFWHVTEPKGLYFDEVYYTKDAYGLLINGYETNSEYCQGAAFVVHPPLGKWLMAASEALFGKVDCFGHATGDPELGWRFASALAGTLAVLVLARTARRMFRSTVLGCFAGLLLAFDGLEFVQSRIGILDIFLMTGIVLALACLVLDRDHGRAKLADRMESARAAATSVASGAATGSVTNPTAGSASNRAAGERFGEDADSQRVEGQQVDSQGADSQRVAVGSRLAVGSWLAVAPSYEKYGPKVGGRPWRLACGVCLGASLGVKWSALYTVVGFAALAIAWDIGARRTAGARRPVTGALFYDLMGWAASFIVVPIVTFLATWTGWFVTHGGHDRDKYPGEGPFGLFGVAHGWWDYQMAIYHFHSTLSSPHPYQSTPWSWLVLGRPVAYYYTSPKLGEHGCDATVCSREVIALGNPAIWWVGVLALLGVIALWVSRRDWRASLVLVGFGSAFVPWLAFPNRTMFFFYALPLLPFLVLGLTAVAGVVIGPKGASEARRFVGALTIGVYAVIVVWLFVYFYPILAAETIPTSEWRQRMWFPGWI